MSSAEDALFAALRTMEQTAAADEKSAAARGQNAACLQQIVTHFTQNPSPAAGGPSRQTAVGKAVPLVVGWVQETIDLAQGSHMHQKLGELRTRWCFEVSPAVDEAQKAGWAQGLSSQGARRALLAAAFKWYFEDMSVGALDQRFRDGVMAIIKAPHKVRLLLHALLSDGSTVELLASVAALTTRQELDPQFSAAWSEAYMDIGRLSDQDLDEVRETLREAL